MFRHKFQPRDSKAFLGYAWFTLNWLLGSYYWMMSHSINYSRASYFASIPKTWRPVSLSASCLRGTDYGISSLDPIMTLIQFSNLFLKCCGTYAFHGIFSSKFSSRFFVDGCFRIYKHNAYKHIQVKVPENFKHLQSILPSRYF